ncbi:MAG: 3'-5' exonuclease [Saprospiraceae bacterium]|nr:3'-5' exonuclease [Lewinella sp.]
MELPLKKNLCFFDIESTGLNVVRDRILQIAIKKFFADGREPENLSMLINPGVPISIEAMLVHGIQPKDVANKPVFAQVAQQLYEFIGDSDLAGYNSNRFDIPLLMEEFSRVGMEFNLDNRRTIDVQRIFYKMEPRTLKAALKYYCDKDMEDAHDAMADVEATVEVFFGQLKRYDGVDHVDGDGLITKAPIVPDVQSLHEFTNDMRFVDATQKLRYDHDGTIVFNFGKYNGKAAAEVLVRDKQYYNWILNKEFTSQVKQIVKKLVRDFEKSQKE